MFSDEEVQGLYAQARKEVGYYMRKHRGPWPDWTQDVVQEAVVQAFEAGWLSGKTKQNKVIRRAVRQAMREELV